VIKKLQPDLIQIRTWCVNFYLLIEDTGITLIDGGFIGAVSKIEQAIEMEGFTWGDMKHVILTHGHLDHTL